MKRAIQLLFFLTLVSLTRAEITRVEPSFWWTGMNDPTLQLLIQGNDIGSAEVTLDTDVVQIASIERVSNANYLFLYLTVDADVEAQKFHIDLRYSGKTERIPYELKERVEGADQVEGFKTHDVVYLITPDRFANGDPSNDSVPGMRETAVDRSEPYGRHGGDLRGIIDRLDYLADLGVTAIWLNPVLENDMSESSYHGYAITDFYKVDPRYGSNELYLELAEEARERGIKIVMDMIFNHCGSQHWWMSDMPTKDWINYASDFKITNHRRTTHQDPYAAEEDEKLMTEGWFVEAMPDLNLRNPLFKDYMIQNSIWWIEYLGLGGIRQDTYPYPDKHAMAEWCERVMAEYPNFNITGEEWSLNPIVLSYWQKGKVNPDGYEGHLPSLIDFPVQDALERALKEEETWGTGWNVLYEMMSSDHIYPDPANNMVFLTNHDMPRFYMDLEKNYPAYQNGLAFILTTRGIPQLYYGDEILMTHDESDGHGHIRKDFPGGWQDDPINGFTGRGLSLYQQRAQEFTKKLLNWRKGATAVHQGKLTHYAPKDGVYVYFRYTEDETVMVILNKNKENYLLDLTRFGKFLNDKSQATNVMTGTSVSLGEALSLPVQEPTILEITE